MVWNTTCYMFGIFNVHVLMEETHLIPISMAFTFIIVLIPLKENYLKDKYGKEYINYANKTKMLIPFIL
jgi:protein-S-isoprenylcysteine O-methyltransferase Ste14